MIKKILFYINFLDQKRPYFLSKKNSEQVNMMFHAKENTFLLFFEN